MTFPIDICEEAGVRTLHFGSDWIQGAMRIARPWHLELDYTKDMMASLLLRDDARFPRKVLLIGLGAASLTKFLYRNCPQARLAVVEIAPSVVAAARQFFKLPDDPKRINIVIGDGAEFIASTRQDYDLILVDGFDAEARAGDLDTRPFYDMCRARLSSEGILVVNLLGLKRGFKSSHARIEEAFDGRCLAFPSCDSGNVITFATAGDPVCVSLEALREEAHRLKKATGLNLLPTLSRLEEAKSCSGGVFRL
jgi:spermidine synthase